MGNSGITVKVDIDPFKVTQRIIDDKARLFFASTAYKLMFDYIPADTLTLASTVRVERQSLTKLSAQQAMNMAENSGNIRVENKQGIIHFTQPYAHKIYTGSGMHFRKDVHRLATSKWDEAMLLARGDKLQKTMQNYFDKR